MYGMFNWCTSLQKLDISNFELIHEDGTAAEIWGMLEGCTSLRTLRLDNCSNATISKIINESNIDTSAIGGTRAIYCKRENAEGLTAPDNWVFSFIGEEGGDSEIIPSYIPGEFRSNTEITEIKTMVDTSHDNLDSMLAGCTSLVSVNTEDWDVSNVNNMYYIFGECRSLTSLNMSNWNTNNVTNMGEMFIRCTSLESLNLSSFDTSNVENMKEMFRDCRALEELNLNGFKVTSNTNVTDMFTGCSNLRILHLENCNVTTVARLIEEAGLPTGSTHNGWIYVTYYPSGLVVPEGWTVEIVD
jgi:surface protein